MRKIKFLISLLVLLLFNTNLVYSQSISCETADPFCTDTVYDFPTVIDNYDYYGDNNQGISFGCLGSVTNLSWFYMKISEPGDINIHIKITCNGATTAGDVDFASWGPFDDKTCEGSDLYTTATNPNGTQEPDNTVEAVWNFNTPHENMVDCGFSELGEEDLFIPNAVVGQYYMVAVQNYGNCEGFINFQKTGGDGETDCSIVNPVLTANVNSETVCVGDSAALTATITSEGTAPYTYTWEDASWVGAGPHNVAPTSTTTYSVTVTDADGTTTTATGTVTVTPLPTPNISGSGFCVGSSSTLDAGNGYDSYSWAGGETTQTISVNSVGTYSVTVTDNGCSGSDSITINSLDGPTPTITGSDFCVGSSTVLTAEPGYTSYIWSTHETTQSITVDEPGDYSVTVTDNEGCSGSDSLVVSEYAGPTPTISGILGFCDGSSSTLDAGSGYASYVWSTNENTQTITITAAGTYSVTVTDANTCVGSTSVDVNVDVVKVSLPQDQKICQGSSFNIAATVNSGIPAYTYYWNGIPSNSNILTVNPATQTTYSVYVVDTLGCTSNTDEIVISISDPVLIDIYANTDSVCPGDPAIITSAISGGLPPFIIKNDMGNIVSQNETVYPPSTTTYSYTVEDACGYTATDMVTINTYPLPPLSIQADVLQGCAPLLVNFTETSSSEGYTYTWDFDDYDDNNLSLSHNVSHVFDKWGVYDVGVSVESDKGCKNSLLVKDMITVFRIPEAKFDASPDVVSIVDPTIQFINYSEWADEYVWDFGDKDSSNIINPFHSYKEVGTYNVKLIAITEEGCLDTTHYLVTVEELYTLYVPSAFSPDGDNINDYFYATGHGIDLDNFNMKVYNRWGELIWETNDLYGKWDGKIKGKYVQSDTYTWLITLNSFNGTEYQKSGVVTVIR